MIYTELLWNMKDNLLFSFRRISTPLLIVIAFTFNMLLSLTFAFVSHKAGYPINANFLAFDSLWEEIIIVIILAPIIETVVYQYFLVDVTLYLTSVIFKKQSIILAILIPAICFALSHKYNYLYVANTLIAGLSLNLFYVLVKLRKQNAFICTVIVHSVYNLAVFTLKHI